MERRTLLRETPQTRTDWILRNEREGEIDEDFEVSSLGDQKGDDTLTEIGNTGREADLGEDEEFEASVFVPPFPESTSKSDLLTSLNRDPAQAAAKSGYLGLD